MSQAQKKLIILALSCVVIIALLMVVVIYPLLDGIKSLSQEYVDNQEILFKLNGQESLISDLEKNLEENRPSLARTEGAFIDTKETIGFIYDLEKIAEQTHNKVEIKTALAPAQAVDNQRVGEGEVEEEVVLVTSFEVTLNGTYSNLIHYLANLENIPYPPYRMIEIESVNISKIAGGRADESGLIPLNDEINTTLKVKIYNK